MSDFENASTYMKGNSKVSLSNDQKLQLYALFKQGSLGECNTSQPSFFDMVGRAKWNAWKALGAMTTDTAKTKYCELVSELDPSWKKATTAEPSDAVTDTSTDASTSSTKKGGSMFGPVVSTILSEDAPLEDSDKSICDWAKEGNLAQVLACLDAGVPVDQVDEDAGLSSLVWAADAGHVEIVRTLLDRGAAPNFKDADGQTTLHYAAICGHAEVISALLEKGADKNIADGEGELPVEMAQTESIKALLA